MADGDFFRDLICGTDDETFINLTQGVETYGGFGFEFTEDDLASTLNQTLDYPGADYLCVNSSEWDRDALLGSDAFRKIMDYLNVYLTPIIILLGAAGNLVAFLVFTTTHLNRQSSSVYLASLAVVDMLFLLCLSVIWLSWVRVNIFHRHIWCQCVVYLSYVCTFLSVWYVVSFTIERYIIVHYPLKKDLFCSRRRAKTVVGLLAVLAIVLYSFSAFTNGSVSFKTVSVCTPLTRYYTITTVATALDSLFTLLIPSAIIIVMNVRIVIKIMGYAKQIVRVNIGETIKSSNSSDGKHSEIEERSDATTPCSVRKHKSSKMVVYVPQQSTNTRSQNSRRSYNNIAHIRIAHGRTRAQHRTARMLIIVSSVFVILHSPNHVFRIHAFLRSSLDDRYSTDLMALKWHELFQLLCHLNFSINFFLYSAFARQFRTGLRILGTRMAHKFKYMRECLDNIRCKKVNDRNDIVNPRNKMDVCRN